MTRAELIKELVDGKSEQQIAVEYGVTRGYVTGKVSKMLYEGELSIKDGRYEAAGTLSASAVMDTEYRNEIKRRRQELQANVGVPDYTKRVTAGIGNSTGSATPALKIILFGREPLKSKLYEMYGELPDSVSSYIENNVAESISEEEMEEQLKKINKYISRLKDTALVHRG